MFPEYVPRAWRNDPSAAAERRVYEALQAQLSDDYSVHWRVPLYDEEALRDTDGEADFVILHSSFGVLVLEVKGGQIERNGTVWFSTDRHGVRHEIKDAYHQAARAKHIVVRQLRGMRRFEDRRLACGHGVVFPDATHSGSHALGPNAPLAITSFAEAISELGAFAARLMRESAKRDGTGLGAEGVREVEAHLAPRFKLRHPLQATLDADDADIISLTEEQFNVLDLLGREPRVLVTGGAGTGKTLLAVELARRLSERGLRTLVTTASADLADWLGGLFGAARAALVISPLASIDAKLTDAAVQQQILSVDEARALAKKRLGKPMAERLLWITDKLPTLKFDAIILDEAQDLLEEDWTALSLCLNDPDRGPIYAFCDEAQLDDSVEVANLPPGPPYRLSPLQERLPSRFVEITLVDNLRNTQEIFALVRSLYVVPGQKPSDYRCKGPEGEQVGFVEAAGWADVRRELKGLLRRLIVVEQIPASDIAVLYYLAFADKGGRRLPWDDPALTPRGDLGDPRGDVGDPGGAAAGAFWPVAGDPESAGLTVTLATRFRGQERRVVIIVGSPDSDREAYIGLTRPRLYLVLVGTSDDLENWRAHAEGAAGAM